MPSFYISPITSVPFQKHVGKIVKSGQGFRENGNRRTQNDTCKPFIPTNKSERSRLIALSSSLFNLTLSDYKIYQVGQSSSIV
jgi:hypothetical protein